MRVVIDTNVLVTAVIRDRLVQTRILSVRQFAALVTPLMPG